MPPNEKPGPALARCSPVDHEECSREALVSSQHSAPQDIVSEAIKLSARCLSVFPCAADKRPAIPKVNGGRGLHDASTDPAEVRRMFAHPGVALIGVPTGDRSGFDVLDLDYRHGAAEWEHANLARIPETRTHETLNGGRHLLFHHAAGVRNSASSIAPGVDVRGSGGYVIVPPSPGYRVISDVPIEHWPDWLLPSVLAKPRPAAPTCPTGASEPVPDKRLVGLIRWALDRVRAAPDGRKHFILRNTALFLGGIQDRAGFTAAEAIRWLLNVLPPGVKDWRAAEATAAWGLENGRLRPIDLSARPERLPDRRRKETARIACRLLRMGVSTPELLGALYDHNQRRPVPLPAEAIADTARWASSQLAENPNVR
jgi:hypothetical protein